MKRPNIKGISFVHLREFIRENFRPEGYEQICKAIRPAARKILELPLAMQWYPLEDLVDIEKTVAETFFGGDYKQAYRIGKYDLMKSIPGVYRPILIFMNATYLLKRSETLWSTMVDCGELRIKADLDHRRAEATVRGLDPIHEVYCHDVSGSFAGALNACGEKGARVTHPECVLKGGKCCRFELTW